MIRSLFTVLVLSIAMPALAVNPDEVLDDPVLEERARDISAELRCLVCQNENIDFSNADLARDLRLLVRERLVAGDSDDEVVDYVVERYGEFVLLRPVLNMRNAVLWFSGPLLLVLALIISIAYIRRRPGAAPPIEGLSAEETARLDEVLKR